jgi:diadenosine tetraphosphate (Ap4A) HIT family hydrolase
VIRRDKFCRVVIVRDPDYAGYCRVIWNSHVKEMTDLPVSQRTHCMRIVFAVEQAVRAVFAPDKINLASFGNMAPHLHWHIIPRYAQDAHFPNPVWGRRMLGRNPKAAIRAPANWRSALQRKLAQIL